MPEGFGSDRPGCPVCTQRRAAGINERGCRRHRYRGHPHSVARRHPRNDTNPTTAPTRSANVYYGRIVVFGTVGCKAGSEVLGSGRSTENKSPGVVRPASPRTSHRYTDFFRLARGRQERTLVGGHVPAQPELPAKVPNSRPDCRAGACCGSTGPRPYRRWCILSGLLCALPPKWGSAIIVFL